jgi:catechol 2,3-dioxygenase-like lactoylglutathione lyase family enzyme
LPGVQIQEFFHLVHIVDDEDAVDPFYDRLFAPQRFTEKHWMEGEKRWASLSMVSDLMLEVIEPSGEASDAHMPLSKFRIRHGQHFHSLSWYLDPAEVKAVFDQLRAAGVRVAKPGGGVFPEGDVDPGNTIFTHPKDTFGQLEFEGKRDHWEGRDPRFQPGWSTDRWRDGPLGIERLSHMTTVVRDLDRARSFYADVLGGVVLSEETSADARHAFVLVGPDTIVDLAEPAAAGTRLAADLAEHGELPHSASFRVRDLAAAEKHVASLGIAVAERGADTIMLDPADCFGALWVLTERDVPGDPRVADLA